MQISPQDWQDLSAYLDQQLDERSQRNLEARLQGEPDLREALEEVRRVRLVLRMVTNTCYDELRRQKRRPTTPLEPLDEDDQEVESPAWLADPGETPEEATERKELALAIQRCLGDLPDEFRSVVILVDIQGLDYGEASQAIQKPVGTVKSRLARARLKLRDCLHRFWELLPSAFRLDSERNA